MNARQSETREPPAYRMMIGLSLLFTVLMIITLLPNPWASKPNILGYRSVCSFAPAASALCGLLAGITCTLRARLVSSRKAANRFRPVLLPAFVGLVLATVAIVSGIRFVSTQSAFEAIIRTTDGAAVQAAGFTDGTRSASASEGEVTATVEVSVQSGKIVSIRLIDGVNMEESVVRTMTEAVVAAQSTEVDAVSGATASSLVLLQAIGKAASR